MRSAGWTGLPRGLLAALAALLLAGCAGHEGGNWVATEAVKKAKNPLAVDAAVLAAGKRVYQDKCLNCHGENGDGRGPQAWMYSVQPSDFTDAKKMGRATDGELFWKIAKGRRPMPSFQGKLSEREVWELVAYIRTFAPKPAAKSSAGGP
jgi:mono/diheme cytochrome c family protein